MATTAKKFNSMKVSKALKPGSARVKFGDVVRLSKTRCQDPLAEGYERFIGLEHIDPEDLRIRRWGNVSDGTTFTNVFEPGQVLFGKRRAYQRKVAVADFSGVCSGDIYVLESKDAKVLLPELLPFLCQTDAFFEHAVGTSAGSLSPRTNWSSLADFEFALLPKEEQLRFVEVLRAATESSEAYEGALHAVRSVTQAFKDNLLQIGATESCHEHLLGELLTGSPESGCSAPPRDADTGYFVLGLSALTRYGYRRGDYKPVEPTNKMLAAKLRGDDLLISRSNTVDRVGYVGIFDEDRDDVSFPDTMMRLTANRHIVAPQYLEALLQSTLSREFLMRISAGTSASMKKINRTNLLKLKLPVPGVDTQRAFLRDLAELNEAVATIENRREAARNITARLINEAVAGRGA